MQNRYSWITVGLFLVGITIGYAAGRYTTIIEKVPVLTSNLTSNNQVAKQNTIVQASTSSEQQTQQTETQETIMNISSEKVSVENDATLGSDKAKVTIVEFSDFQCPYCKKYFDNNFQKIQKDFIRNNKIYYAFRDFPLDIHPQAPLAAEASECAHAQNKYWEMHDMLFSRQDVWSFKDNAADTFKAFAKELKLDTKKFNDCLYTHQLAGEITKDIADGEKAKISGTPTVFINDIKIKGYQPYDTYKSIIESELRK